MDTLKMIGIDSNGYGRIYKSVMRDKNLHITAKAIYSYFCAYAGNGTTAFPKRDKITRDLKLNKDTFTKYLSVLVDSGYITKQRTTTGNLYSIVMSVPNEAKDRLQDSIEGDRLIVSNVKAQGFGTVPKLAMLDKNLTLQAKSIYSYFCSFAGAGIVAFPHKATIIRELKISSGTYYSHFGLLTKYGYITATQTKKNGRFDVCEYFLNEEIAEQINVENIVENLVETVENSLDIPMYDILQYGGKTSENLLSEKVMSEKPVIQNLGQPNINNIPTSNSSKNNTLYKEHNYNHQAPVGAHEDNKKPIKSYTEKIVKEMIGFISLQSEVKAYVELKETLNHFGSTQDKCDYEEFTSQVLKEIPKQIVAFLALKSKMVLIDGKEYDYAKLKCNLLTKLNQQDISDLLFAVVDKFGMVRVVRQYVKKAVWNLAVEGMNSKLY